MYFSNILKPWWRHQMDAFPRYWPFVRETTGHRLIPLTKASDSELWCFLQSAAKQTVEQTIETPVISDAIWKLFWSVLSYKSNVNVTNSRQDWVSIQEVWQLSVGLSFDQTYRPIAIVYLLHHWGSDQGLEIFTRHRLIKACYNHTYET